MQVFFVALPEATPSRFGSPSFLGGQTRSAQRNNNLHYKKLNPQSTVSTWRYYNTFSISEKICSLNEKELKKRNFHDARILTHWQDSVGDEFANKLHPKQIKIVGTDNKFVQKILYCFTDDRRFANEFSFHKKDLLERLNLYFGDKKEVFVDIKISF